jgi:hypothetical protein
VIARQHIYRGGRKRPQKTKRLAARAGTGERSFAAEVIKITKDAKIKKIIWKNP